MQQLFVLPGIGIALYLLISCALYMSITHESAHFDIDSHGYDRIAFNFAEHGQLIDPLRPDSAPIQPVGYPFFLGLIYAVGGHQLLPVIMMQILLGVLCIILTFLIAQQIGGTNMAYIALFLSVFNVGFITYPQFVLAEILMLTFLLLFWYFLIHCFDAECPWYYYVLSGIFCGLSIVVKSTALLFLPVVGLFLALCKKISVDSDPFVVSSSNHTNTSTLRQAQGERLGLIKQDRMKNAGLFLLSASIPIISYMSYNYVLWGYFSLAPLTSLNLYQVFLSKVIGRITGHCVEEVITTQLSFTGAHSFDESGWHAARALFFSYFKEYPGTFILVWLQNVCKSAVGLFSTQLKLLGNPLMYGGDCSFFKMNGTCIEKMIAYIQYGANSVWLLMVVWLEVVMSLVRIPFAITGFIVLWRKKGYGIAMLLSFYSLQCLFITGFDGCARYRFSCEPLILILVATGIWRLYKTVKNKA